MTRDHHQNPENDLPQEVNPFKSPSDPSSGSVHTADHIKEKAKKLESEFLDWVEHPGRCVKLGASLAEGMAGESLGEMVGASLGTVIGPEGTLLGAELGGLAGEALGAHEGDLLAKRFLHENSQPSTLAEDVKKASSAKVGSQAGKEIGEIIGDLVLDSPEIGEEVGEKIGKLAGTLAFNRIEKKERIAETGPDSEKELPSG